MSHQAGFRSSVSLRMEGWFQHPSRVICNLLKTLANLSVCGFLTLSPAIAQEPQPSSGADFRVESQLVVLDLVVTDDKGNVVTNLGREDFSVYENGVPQDIRNFDLPAKEKEKLTSLPEIAPKDKNGNDNWGDAPLTILVVDALNTPFEETAYTRQQVDRFLKAQPALLKQPTIALWLNDSGFHPVVQGFTRDRNALMSAIDAHKASLPDKMNRGAVVEQLSASLSALQQMAVFSRGNKGSKQIIWVGRSFPGVNNELLDKAQTDLLNKAVSSTLNLLMESRAVVYVIDPTVTAPEQTVAISDIAGPNAITPFVADDPFAHSFSFMGFAKQTGGDYFFGRNDLNNEIASSIDRGTNFYSLSYVPNEPIRDGKYRKIDIHLSNPKLHIQAKQGYYPAHPADEVAPNDKDLKFDLHEALVTGMTYTGVGLHIESCRLDGNHITSTCVVSVDNNSLSFASAPDDSFERTNLVAAIAALDAKSLLLSNKVMKFQLGIPSNLANQKELGSTKLHLQIVVPPAAKAVRIAVRDTSGRIGVASVDPLVVRKLFPAAVVHPGK
jgi:VWFA-related protein